MQQSGFTLTLLDASTYGEARCLDGTQAGYYVETSKTSDNWLVFFEGGGW